MWSQSKVPAAECGLDSVYIENKDQLENKAHLIMQVRK